MSQSLFWIKEAIFNPVAETYEYYFLRDLSVSSVIFLVNSSLICYNLLNRIYPLILSREAGKVLWK